MLASHDDEPSTSASRLLDWDSFLSEQDERYAGMVADIASGKNAMECARETGSSYFTIRQIREMLAEDVLEYFGDEAIADSFHQPSWRAGINSERERYCCRADRGRW